jgi:TonB family protein
MNAISSNLPATRSRFTVSAIVLFIALCLVPTISSFAQARQLSLADILIALRSPKVTLVERNRILADAVKERGVTFTLAPQLENELATTGASPELLAAIREVTKPKVVPTPVPTPIPTPTPPDYAFYAKRAEGNAGKGEFTLALADFDKAAEMRADEPTVLAGRAKTHFNLKSYDKALTDYDRVVELSPKDPAAFYFRGLTYERAGKTDKALADYKKAAELDPKHDNAVASAKRLTDDIAKAAAEAEKARIAALKPVRPEILDLGNISPSSAERMVKPTYPPIAQRGNIEGRVTVDVEMDSEGKIVEAKATSGHQMLRQAAEDAARRSRFKPATFDGTPIRAKGVIIYNFSTRAGSE